MTIAAKLSSTELDKILRDRYVGNYFEARLINSPGTSYVPGGGVADSVWLGNEVTVGTGGYQRQVIYYENTDVSNYADGGVALAQKGTTFAHDGGATDIEFTHVALVWSSGNVMTLGAVTAAPASATTTTESYTNIPIDITSGSGVGMTVDLEVTNSGAATTDYVLTINKPGYGYAASDTLGILNATLLALDPSIGAGGLSFSAATVHSPTVATAGDLFTITKPASAVTLTAGNEAVFYWNLKQYGFYSQS